jgi:hypothetical protein
MIVITIQRTSDHGLGRPFGRPLFSSNIDPTKGEPPPAHYRSQRRQDSNQHKLTILTRHFEEIWGLTQAKAERDSEPLMFALAPGDFVIVALILEHFPIRRHRSPRRRDSFGILQT